MLIRRGPRQCSYAEEAHVGELRAANDPSLAMVRFIPNAKLSSLPLNHFATAVVTATIRDSAPSPKTSLPAAMGINVSLSAVMTDPRRQRRAKMNVDFFVPRRSMMNPPIRTMNMFGTL